MAYVIRPEFHETSEVFYDGHRLPPLEFHYAIRRGDGSLVFRASTIKQADELLAGLTALSGPAA